MLERTRQWELLQDFDKVKKNVEFHSKFKSPEGEVLHNCFWKYEQPGYVARKTDSHNLASINNLLKIHMDTVERATSSLKKHKADLYTDKKGN